MAGLPLPEQQLPLPDFCQVRALFSAVILGEVLACVLVLSPLGQPSYHWEDIGLVSLFVQWVVLASVGLLCLLRRFAPQLRGYPAAALSYLGVLAVTGLLSHLAWIFVVNPVPAKPYFSDLHYHIFQLRNLSISALVGAVGLRYFYAQYHWRMTTLAAAEARVQALQARIRPHFLFNALNSIASLTRIDPKLAEQAVEDLAELFRVSVADVRQKVTLAEEVALCRQYLRLENLRLGERIRVEWLIDTLPQDALLPPLTLQPLLENAVCYGIQPSPEGGVIRVTGLCDGRHLKIDVESPLPPEVLPVRRKGLHLAQDNLRQRLHAFYGRHGRLDISRGAGVYQVSLRFPYEHDRTL